MAGLPGPEAGSHVWIKNNTGSPPWLRGTVEPEAGGPRYKPSPTVAVILEDGSSRTVDRADMELANPPEAGEQLAGGGGQQGRRGSIQQLRRERAVEARECIELDTAPGILNEPELLQRCVRRYRAGQEYTLCSGELLLLNPALRVAGGAAAPTDADNAAAAAPPLPAEAVAAIAAAARAVDPAGALHAEAHHAAEQQVSESLTLRKQVSG
jgi:hypothetical protein